MRHNNSGKRLGRNSSQRLAMMRNMVTSLIQHEKITTTDTKAKELRKLADKMVTLGKKNSLHSRRQALRVVRDRATVARLFDLLAPRYHNRPGGYTRIIKLGNRQGDNAPISRIEFVEELDPANIKVRKTAKVEEPVAKVEAPAAEEVAAAQQEAPVEEAVTEEAGEVADEPEEKAETTVEAETSAEAEVEAETGEEKKEDQ
ncbi:MAG: 50S ribosomal protein L17 [Deltaproteobacteria bacterium]|nr:50S ribosomal protein L17 [Deltaproteobacteria bacterium]